jgi:beta-mannanase
MLKPGKWYLLGLALLLVAGVAVGYSFTRQSGSDDSSSDAAIASANGPITFSTTQPRPESRATPFFELEPWNAGPNWNQTPSMVDIGNNAASDCGQDGMSSCAAWLASIGQDVAAFGHPVIFTFAHEFNVSGQYPWSQGDSEGTTPAQWIRAWDTVQADIDNNGGGQNAFWMWAPNVDTGGSSEPFAPWWPGASHVNMVGLDGYPQPQYGLNTFQQVFGQSFSEMKALTNLPIFISETDLSPETGANGTQTAGQFVQAALADGATGLLQFQDGSPALSSQQWSQVDAALANAG